MRYHCETYVHTHTLLRIAWRGHSVFTRASFIIADNRRAPVAFIIAWTKTVFLPVVTSVRFSTRCHGDIRRPHKTCTVSLYLVPRNKTPVTDVAGGIREIFPLNRGRASRENNLEFVTSTSNAHAVLLNVKQYGYMRYRKQFLGKHVKQ